MARILHLVQKGAFEGARPASLTMKFAGNPLLLNTDRFSLQNSELSYANNSTFYLFGADAYECFSTVRPFAGAGSIG